MSDLPNALCAFVDVNYSNKYTHFYRPQTKLREGYVFTGVCDFVHRGRAWLLGVCVVAGGVCGCGGCMVAGGACMVAGGWRTCMVMGVGGRCAWLEGHAWLLGGGHGWWGRGNAWLQGQHAWLQGGMCGCGGVCVVAGGVHVCQGVCRI